MADTLEEARHEVADAKAGPFGTVNGVRPVIVKTEYSKGKFCFGVQFWGEYSIQVKRSRNSDGTVSVLVEEV